MTWKERRERRLRLQKNLTDHLDLDANAELPESHDLGLARSLIFTLSATLVVLVIWSSQTEVSEIVTGRGVIKTEIQLERVEHPIGGQVRAIEVGSGAQVRQGARILTFETDTLIREIEKQRAALEALVTERARIDFVLDGRLPEDMPGTTLASTPDGLLFWTEQRFLEAQLDVISSSRKRIEATLISLASQRASLDEELSLLRDKLVRSERGLASGALSKNEVDQQRAVVLQAERAVLSIDADIAAEQAALNGTDLKAAELLAQRRREAALRLADLESSITGARLTIAELEARVRRSEVVATIDGTILHLGVSHAGEVIDAGEVIAEIVPNDTEVQAEIEIPASKIGGILTGMLVRIKVETFDFTRFGELEGQVTEISPSSFETPDGATVYKVTVHFNGDKGIPTLDGRALRPGMTVTADILTESKTVLTYILKPLRLLRDRAFTEA